MTSIFGIYNLATGILLLLFCPFILKLIKEHWDDNRYASQSSILVMISCIVVGLYFIILSLPVFLQALKVNFANELMFIWYRSLMELPLPIPFSSFVFYFGGIIFLFITVYYFYESWQKKWIGTVEPKDRRKIHSLDKELSRKTFHICVIGVIVCYLIVGDLIGTAVYDSIAEVYDFYFKGFQSFYRSIFTIPYNLTDPTDPTNVFNPGDIIYLIQYGPAVWFPGIELILGKGICVFAFVIIGNLLMITDFIRIYNYRFYPIKEITFVYREKERSVLGPHIFLVFGILFSTVLFSGPIAMSTIAMSGFGDACATIVGVSIGKRHIQGGKSKKTWEGCIAGFTSSFAFGVISYVLVGLIWYRNLSFMDILIIGTVVNLIGATAFFLFDYFSPPIELSDNIVNPIMLPIIMGLSSLFIFGVW
ncbi:MAG: hypothetical protein ACTSR3_10155 [Candidatus Helarchaeota archaeon]